jgi:hypothetical protein
MLRAATAVFAAFTSLAVQQARTIDPNAIPVDKEPQHHLVFANDFVRVVDARLPPGYKSLNHTHALDNVTVTISPGSTDAQAVARIGRAGFSRGGYSHTVTNSGSIELRFINVELLRADSPGSAAFPDQPQHKLETENERVRVYRIKLAPGESLPAHRHSSGWIAVTVAGGTGPGSFQWYAAGASNPLTAGPSGLEVVELEPR